LEQQKFLIDGNICGARIRLARALHKPPLTQNALAIKLNLKGIDITEVVISRIELNKRHVCDAELLAFSQALGVSMEWLCGDDSDWVPPKPRKK